MTIYTSLDGLKLENTAVALGKFDALHKGHQYLFGRLNNYKKQGFQTVIFTFDFHPANLLTGKRQKVIYSRSERRDIFRETGADVLLEFPFTKDTAHMSADDFVKHVLVECLGCRVIVVGEDFHFGYQRSGDVCFLRDNEKKYGYKVDSSVKLGLDGDVISSTRIRECVREGDLEEASRLLGRCYSISGRVVRGKGNGRTVDMPTANIIPDEYKLLPPDGVYASRTCINRSSQMYYSITNIGTNPTVGEDNIRSVETFLLDFDGNIYDQEIHVDLYKRLRGEIRFPDLRALRTRVEVDKQDAIDYFRQNNI